MHNHSLYSNDTAVNSSKHKQTLTESYMDQRWCITYGRKISLNLEINGIRIYIMLLTTTKQSIQYSFKDEMALLFYLLVVHITILYCR